MSGVEIFSAGVWNGDKFDIKDLEKMIESFNQTKEGVRPFLKLGHDKNQQFAQKDGLPSLGWIDKMYLKGEKLVADFVDIPKKVYDLIKVGAYKKVSCEMFFNVKIKEKKFNHLITAVSLLGADTPAVMNLNDIHALYFGVQDTPEAKAYDAVVFSFNEVTQGKEIEMSKTEKEIKLELDLESTQKDFAAQKELADKLAKEKADAEKELEQLRQFKADADKKALEAAEALRAEQIKNFTTTLVSEKLATPSMQPLIAELVGDKKEFSVKVGEKSLTTKEEIVKEILKLFKSAAEMNFESSTEGGAEKSFSADQEKALEEKIKKYMNDKKVSYTQAYKAIMKEGK